MIDKACVDFDHLWNLAQRGVFSAPRAQVNLQSEVIERPPPSKRAAKSSPTQLKLIRQSKPPKKS